LHLRLLLALGRPICLLPLLLLLSLLMCLRRLFLLLRGQRQATK
jgi:hypothetical protein